MKDAVEVKVNREEFERVVNRLKAFGPYEMDRMITRAINRTGKKARTRAVRLLAQRLKKKQKEVRKSVRLTPAKINHQVATLSVLGRFVPIGKLNPKQTAEGVMFDAPDGRRLLPRGFIATMPTGHTGVFLREPVGGGHLLDFLKGQGWHARRRVRRVEALLGGMANATLVGRLPIWQPRWDVIGQAAEHHNLKDILGRYTQTELYNQLEMAISHRLKEGQILKRLGPLGYRVVEGTYG